MVMGVYGHYKYIFSARETDVCERQILTSLTQLFKKTLPLRLLAAILLLPLDDLET